MNVTNMKKRDFDNVPLRNYDDPVEPFYSMVIIPTHKRHDSGFEIMDFVFCNKQQEPVCRLSGCSDVIHIDGIGGYGDWRDTIPKSRPIEAWSIDCLPCGYLRLFCQGTITCGHAISDFEVFWNKLQE